MISNPLIHGNLDGILILFPILQIECAVVGLFRNNATRNHPSNFDARIIAIGAGSLIVGSNPNSRTMD
jgi:hypothetical protein